MLDLPQVTRLYVEEVALDNSGSKRLVSLTRLYKYSDTKTNPNYVAINYRAYYLRLISETEWSLLLLKSLMHVHVWVTP